MLKKADEGKVRAQVSHDSDTNGKILIRSTREDERMTMEQS